jgi:tetratricopeptide (TPR) repeat protein
VDLGRVLASPPPVDSVAIVAAVRELFAAGQFPGAAAVCAGAIPELAPTDRSVVALRLLAARSLLALRRDAEAQLEIRACLEAEPHCGPAYRLLGQLALRYDELASARVFLREALRLDRDDHEAGEWLGLVDGLTQRRGRRERPRPRPAATRAIAAPRPRPLVLPIRAEGSAPGVRRPRAPSPPLPVAAGFGQHLVACGLLSPVQLKAALAYKRSTGVRLGAAAVALGFVSEPKIEWASLAYHGRHRARDAVARVA